MARVQYKTFLPAPTDPKWTSFSPATTEASMPSQERHCWRSLRCWVASPGQFDAAPPRNRVSHASARSATVTRITEELVVDGVLDEPPWQTAPKIGDMIQREPRNGERPTERTEVTLLHDRNNLYIGVMCYDSEPKR